MKKYADIIKSADVPGRGIHSQQYRETGKLPEMAYKNPSIVERTGYTFNPGDMEAMPFIPATAAESKGLQEANAELWDPRELLHNMNTWGDRAVEKAPGAVGRVLGGVADLGRLGINLGWNGLRWLTSDTPGPRWTDAQRKAQDKPPRQQKPFQYQDIMNMKQDNFLTAWGKKDHPYLSSIPVMVRRVLSPLSIADHWLPGRDRFYVPLNKSIDSRLETQFFDRPEYSTALKQFPGGEAIMDGLAEAMSDSAVEAGIGKINAVRQLAKNETARANAIQTAVTNKQVPSYQDFRTGVNGLYPIQVDKQISDTAKKLYKPTLIERIFPNLKARKLKELSKPQNAADYLVRRFSPRMEAHPDFYIRGNFDLGDFPPLEIKGNLGTSYSDIIPTLDSSQLMKDYGLSPDESRLLSAMIGDYRSAYPDAAAKLLSPYTGKLAGRKLTTVGAEVKKLKGNPALWKGWSNNYPDVDEAMRYGSMSGNEIDPDQWQWLTPMPDVPLTNRSYMSPGGSLAMIEQPASMRSYIKGGYTPHMAQGGMDPIDIAKDKLIHPENYVWNHRFGNSTPGISTSPDYEVALPPEAIKQLLRRSPNKKIFTPVTMDEGYSELFAPYTYAQKNIPRADEPLNPLISRIKLLEGGSDGPVKLTPYAFRYPKKDVKPVIPFVNPPASIVDPLYKSQNDSTK